jgi:hypothetical protein
MDFAQGRGIVRADCRGPRTGRVWASRRLGDPMRAKRLANASGATQFPQAGSVDNAHQVAPTRLSTRGPLRYRPLETGFRHLTTSGRGRRAELSFPARASPSNALVRSPWPIDGDVCTYGDVCICRHGEGLQGEPSSALVLAPHAPTTRLAAPTSRSRRAAVNLAPSLAQSRVADQISPRH